MSQCEAPLLTQELTFPYNRPIDTFPFNRHLNRHQSNYGKGHLHQPAR
jgi:hypothetical protein